MLKSESKLLIFMSKLAFLVFSNTIYVQTFFSEIMGYNVITLSNETNAYFSMNIFYEVKEIML